MWLINHLINCPINHWTISTFKQLNRCMKRAELMLDPTTGILVQHLCLALNAVSQPPNILEILALRHFRIPPFSFNLSISFLINGITVLRVVYNSLSLSLSLSVGQFQTAVCSSTLFLHRYHTQIAIIWQQLQWSTKP